MATTVRAGQLGLTQHDYAAGPAEGDAAPPPGRHLQSHGIAFSDIVHNGRRLVWVGRDDNGRWLSPAQFREFAAAAAKFAEGLPA